MNERQEQLLKVIVEAYIERAEPIGSAFVVGAYDLGVSPATVRNDMAALTAEGYLAQPHTSAGRVPTEKGYEHYLRHFVSHKPEGTARKRLEQTFVEDKAAEDALCELAHTLVELSGETVVLSLAPHRVYFAGLSNLFQKPDFQDVEILQEVSGDLDRLELALMDVARRLTRAPQVFIGQQNPLGVHLSSVVLKYRVPSREGVLGLVGPMRMDYGRNMQLLQMAQELLESTF